MKKKKILICGASGFIGRNLFEILSQRDDLDVYGTYYTKRFSESRKLFRADLTDKESAMTVTSRMDVVINASAVTDGSGAVASSPGRYIANNVRINTNLVESANNNGVPHFIFLSCSIVYPIHNLGLVYESAVNLSKIHPSYWMGARMKLFSEDLCQYFADLRKSRLTIIRHSNNYGPFDKFDTKRGHVFSATVEKIMNPKNNQVIVWGDGSERRDFLHVFDLVRFIEYVIKEDTQNTQNIFNIGSGTSLTIKELVEKINKISGRNLPIRYDASKTTIDTNIILNTTKARKYFDWQPTIDIDNGIRQTIDWYRKNKTEVNNGR